MLYKTTLVFCGLVAVLFCLLPMAYGDDRSWARADAQVLEQSYCEADHDLFTISVKLKINLRNTSDKSIAVSTHMVPWVAKVAATLVDARERRFLFEQTSSHYAEHYRLSDPLQVGPYKSVGLDSGYDFVARKDPNFSYPNSLSAGTYAVVLTLRPEGPPRDQNDRVMIGELTTEPFVLKVPKNPKLSICK